MLDERVQVLVVYGEYGPRVRSRHGDVVSIDHAAAAIRDRVCVAPSRRRTGCNALRHVVILNTRRTLMPFACSRH